MNIHDSSTPGTVALSCWQKVNFLRSKDMNNSREEELLFAFLHIVFLYNAVFGSLVLFFQVLYHMSVSVATRHLKLSYLWRELDEVYKCAFFRSFLHPCNGFIALKSYYNSICVYYQYDRMIEHWDATLMDMCSTFRQNYVLCV